MREQAKVLPHGLAAQGFSSSGHESSVSAQFVPFSQSVLLPGQVNSVGQSVILPTQTASQVVTAGHSKDGSVNFYMQVG